MVTDARPGVPPFIRLAAQPLRWRLLTALAASDRRVRELVEQVEEPQNLVSYHLRLLRDAGLVTTRRSSHDGRDTYYHLDLERCADGLASAGAALHPWLRPTATTRKVATTAPPRMLFVCTGNSARSPMAEALLRHHTAGRVPVASAGINPRARVHPHAIRVLRERFDLNIDEHEPCSLDDVAGHDARFDHVVTLCDKARERLPALEGCRRTHWSVPDPADGATPATYAGFVAVAADIDARVRQLIPMLDHEGPSPR